MLWSDDPNTNPHPTDARALMPKATLSPKSGFANLAQRLIRSKHLQVTSNNPYIHTYSCRESETVALYTTKVTLCLDVRGNPISAPTSFSLVCRKHPRGNRQQVVYTRSQPSHCSGGHCSQVKNTRQSHSTSFVAITRGSCLHSIHTNTHTHRTQLSRVCFDDTGHLPTPCHPTHHYTMIHCRSFAPRCEKTASKKATRMARHNYSTSSPIKPPCSR